MTPKEKAKELVERFKIVKVGLSYCYLSNIEAKEFALICTEEIIMGLYDYAREPQYWYDVQEEIKFL